MKHSNPSNSLLEIHGARIAILQSSWYREYSDSMVKKCADVLTSAGSLQPDIHILPGSLELPLAAQRIARKKDNAYDAIICFGVVMKGGTHHYEMVLYSCIHGLTQVMLNEDIPIIMEILPVTTEQQIIERTSDDNYNKGIEAAHAAIETIAWRRNNPV